MINSSQLSGNVSSIASTDLLCMMRFVVEYGYEYRSQSIWKIQYCKTLQMAVREQGLLVAMRSHEDILVKARLGYRMGSMKLQIRRL